MCYLVTSLNTTTAAITAREHSIYDTEQEARDYAESQLKAGRKEVAVWKQVAAPSLVQQVHWGDEQ